MKEVSPLERPNEIPARHWRCGFPPPPRFMGHPSSRFVILHVTAPSRVGGLERVVEALSVGHVARGHSVHVIAVVESPGDGDHFLRPLEARGVHPHPLVLPGRAYVRERAAIAEICRTIQPTVMHTHGYRADVLASGIARRLGVRAVTTVHGFTGGGWRNRLYEAMQIRAFQRFDSVVAVSRPIADLLKRRGVPYRKVRLLANAWGSPTLPQSRDASRAILGIPASAFCVGWVGRLTKEKAADVLLDAAALLPRDVSISFLGDGRERAPLEARTAELGLIDRVRWHGMHRDAGALMRAFDVLVLSSHTEGTPIVLFEAMGAEVPVVATRVGGVPDVVSEMEAILVPANDPSALAIAITRIRDNPAGAALRVAAAAIRLRRVFALEPWLAAYEGIYRGNS